MNRKQSIDLIKIIAMFGVIALHSCYKYINPDSFSIADLIYDCGVISMPLFFMVSGYLLIPRENINYKYSAKKIFGIIKFVFIINLIYWFVDLIRGYASFSDLLYNTVGALLQKGPFSVFWYFGAMIICYSLLPIICNLYKTKSLYYILISVLFLSCSLVFTQTLTCQLNNELGVIVEYQIPATFRLWYILFYFLLGGLIYNLKFNISKWFVLFLFLISIGYIEIVDNIIKEEHCSLYYSAVPIILLCILLFLKINSINIEHNRLISELSVLFLPVYAIHSFVISHIPNLATDNRINAVIAFIFSVIISLLVSYLVMKIKFLKNIFKI